MGNLFTLPKLPDDKKSLDDIFVGSVDGLIPNQTKYMCIKYTHKNAENSQAPENWAIPENATEQTTPEAFDVENIAHSSQPGLVSLIQGIEPVQVKGPGNINQIEDDGTYVATRTNGVWSDFTSCAMPANQCATTTDGNYTVSLTNGIWGDLTLSTTNETTTEGEVPVGMIREKFSLGRPLHYSIFDDISKNPYALQ